MRERRKQKKPLELCQIDKNRIIKSHAGALLHKERERATKGASAGGEGQGRGVSAVHALSAHAFAEQTPAGT